MGYTYIRTYVIGGSANCKDSSPIRIQYRTYRRILTTQARMANHFVRSHAIYNLCPILRELLIIPYFMIDSILHIFYDPTMDFLNIYVDAMRCTGISEMKANLQRKIQTVQRRIERTATLNSRNRNYSGINVALLHGNKEVGRQWCAFIQKLFIDELPEEYRDMNLDVISESVTSLAEDEISSINSCDFKMVLFDSEVLKILKDKESIFRTSGVLELQPERVIILLLGDEKNKNFYHEAKLTLCDFTDHDGFNMIQAKNPSQIFSEVMTILSPIHIVPHPSIMSCEDKEQHITFISSKPYPIGSSIEYVIELSSDRKTREVSASLFNPYTLLMPNPGHPPGLVTVRIFICTSVLHPNEEVPEISRTQIAEDLQVWFQSDLDKVYAILDSQNNPMSFLCQGLQEDPLDRSTNATDKIDKLLTESFKQNVPDNKLFLVFGNDQQTPDDQDRISSEYVPTLLHFSAMYGLRDLTAALLQCPGAVIAYGTANSEGDYPTTLAEKFGHWTLRDFMQNFMEVAALVHEEYGEKSSLQMSQIMSSMVQGQYVRLTGETNDPEDIYIQLDGVLTPLSAPVGYLSMQPLKQGESLGGEESEFMIRKMFQNKSDEPETDYEILDGGIPRLNPVSSALQPRTFIPESYSPPVPPPREDKTMGSKLNFQPKELLTEIHTNVSPAQEELIALQKKVKDNEITINQAVFRFKEWERKHKERAASFQFQQENLQRVRQSLMRSRDEKKMRGESVTITISDPIVAGSSTYGQVLLKTRKEVMLKGPHSDATPPDTYCPQAAPRSQKVTNPPGSNSEASSGNASFRRFRTSFRNSFEQSPSHSPDSSVINRTRWSIDSKGSSQSSIRSSSSDSSHRRLPPIPAARPSAKPKDFAGSGGYHYDANARNAYTIREDEISPPPVPPRDVRATIPDGRPALPPRSPHLR